MRQHILSVILVAFAFASLGGIVAPERAAAQVTCSNDVTGAVLTTDVTTLIVNFPASGSPSCLDNTHSVAAYDDPTGTNIAFQLYLPATSAGAPPPVKIFAKAVVNGAGTSESYEISDVTCTGAPSGATIDSSNPYVWTIALEAGESCELYAYWENNGDPVSFSGATLSRVGNAYEISGGGVVAGGQFGGSAASTNGPAIDVQRNGVSFSDGDTDDQGTQTVGVDVALDYTICNTGTVELTGVNVFVENEQNLQDPVQLVNNTNSNDLGSAQSIAVHECLEFTATYTPTDPISFSFDLKVNNGTTTVETLAITVSGSDSAVLGTMNTPQIIARTQRIIANFMGRRASQIVGREPDLTKRLGDGGDSSSASGPVNVTGEGTANNNNLAFATSLRQVIGSTQVAKRRRAADNATRMALGARRDGGHGGGSLKDEPVADHVSPLSRNKFGLWAEGTWAKVDNDTAESDFGLLYVGADYRFNSGLVVGLIAQFDRTDEEDDTNGFSIKGKGWLAGPYVVARLSSNLIFDARAAWGKSDNEVSPFNTYTDEFDGQRWLVRSRLTGDFTFGRLHVAPHVGVIYFEEKQKAYTDSNGYAIGEQTVELGRLTFGPKISTSFTRPDGTTIAPFVAVQGIWDFKRTDQVNIDTGLAVTGTDKVRARAEAGLSVRLPQGVAITGEGFYDGIGADGYNAYGGSVKVGVPF